MWCKMRVNDLDESDRHLTRRGDWFHYVRRIPMRLQRFCTSNRIRVSLDTKDPLTARAKRDALAKADEEYWACLTHAAAMETAGQPIDTDTAKRQYKMACSSVCCLLQTPQGIWSRWLRRIICDRLWRPGLPSPERTAFGMRSLQYGHGRSS